MPDLSPNGKATGLAVASIIDQARHLLNQGRCPLPVAPAFPAEQYPAKGKDGKIQLDKDGNTKPAFTGKNPSYIDAQGKPRSVNHARYQTNRPTEQDVSTWFANPATGIGELCGFEGLYQLDFDWGEGKQFESPEAVSSWFFEWRGSHPQLAQAPIERTHSGGFHLQIKLTAKPGFTNFALEPGGAHIGELLGSGRFCVLAPTIGPSGKAYEVLQDGEAPLIEDLGAIGIYSTRKPSEAAPLALLASTPPASPQGPLTALILAPIALADLLCENAAKVLGGGDIKGDKSASFAVLNKESAGWVNWCNLNEVAVSGSVDDLARQGGAALGYGDADIKRKLKTIDQGGCLPACCQGSDDSSAWKKIKRLSPEIWSAHRLKDQAEKPGLSARSLSGLGTIDPSLGQSLPDRKSTLSPVGSDPFKTDQDLQETKIESLQSCNYQLGKWKNKEIEAGQIPNYEKRKAQGDKTIGKITPTKKAWALPDGSTQSLKAKREENDGGEEVVTAANVLIFEPLLGFDFTVVKVIESNEDGGGSMIQAEWLDSATLKRKEFFLKSADLVDVKKFTAAIYKGLGSATLCKLSGHDIQELLQSKKAEYFADGGKTYRLAPCTGRQADGFWVSENVQFRPNGAVCSEEDSLWIFNKSLGVEQHIPSPQIVEQNPQALPDLVRALVDFCPPHLIGFILYALGYGAATAHRQEIMRREKAFPQATFFGDPRGGKTLAATVAASIFGMHTPDKLISSVTESMAYELLKSLSDVTIAIDDPIKPGRGQEKAVENMNELLWNLFGGAARNTRAGVQQPRSNLVVTSNIALGGNVAAAESRLFKMNFPKLPGADFNNSNSAKRALTASMDNASGGLGQILGLGYDQEAVQNLEARLDNHLPQSDARVVKSLALVTHYTQKVCDLAGHGFDALSFCIANLCPQANEFGSSTSSLADCFEKLIGLLANDEIGGHNLTKVLSKGRTFVAIAMQDIWPIFQRRFGPNYNLDTLKNLIKSGGGCLDKNSKFVGSKTEWLDYRRALYESQRATSEVDLANSSSGAPRIPTEPKKTTQRKCVWVPIEVVIKLVGWDPFAGDGHGLAEVDEGDRSVGDVGPQSVPVTSAAAPRPVSAPVLVSKPPAVASAVSPAAPIAVAPAPLDDRPAAAVTADPEPTVCGVGWGIGDRADLLDDGLGDSLDGGLDDDGDDLRLGLGEDQDSVDEEVWA
jgi:hypothetical protein